MKKIGIIIGVIFIIIIATVGIYFGTSKKDNNNKTEAKHEHTFTEATCTTPKTCTICKITEGTALPHTTNIGKCTTCGQLQNEDLSMEIVNTITSVNDNTTNCSKEVQSANLNSASDCFNKFSSVSTKIKNNKEYLKKVIELCGDYPELSNIKENCNQLLNTNINISSSDTNSLTTFLKDFQAYLLTTQNLYENMATLAKLYVK